MATLEGRGRISGRHNTMALTPANIKPRNLIYESRTATWRKRLPDEAVMNNLRILLNKKLSGSAV